MPKWLVPPFFFYVRHMSTEGGGEINYVGLKTNDKNMILSLLLQKNLTWNAKRNGEENKLCLKCRFLSNIQYKTAHSATLKLYSCTSAQKKKRKSIFQTYKLIWTNVVRLELQEENESCVKTKHSNLK